MRYYLIMLAAIYLPSQAFGYVDPGAGQMLLQALSLVFFGLLFYIRSIFSAVRRLFGGWTKSEKISESSK